MFPMLINEIPKRRKKYKLEMCEVRILSELIGGGMLI